jgi:hypothetical protein
LNPHGAVLAQYQKRGIKMLSIEQLTIVAYLHDCTTLCRKCGEANPEVKMGEALSAYEAGEFAGVDGLTCDECGTEIIEPYEWTCPWCDRQYVGDDAADSEREADRDEHSKCCDDCPGDEESEDED